MKIIDISVPIDENLPIWPKVPRPKFNKISSIKKGDFANDSKIEMSAHTGTHIDAPLHFILNGKSVDKIGLERFIGPVFVADLSGVKNITANELKKIKIPKNIKRILFKTDNSKLWNKKVSKFKKDYVALTEDAAEWISKKDIELVGIDYLSIAKFEEAVGVHKILLKNKIAILEAIDLYKVSQGLYKLICLPLKISGLEAGPTRAILIEYEI